MIDHPERHKRWIWGSSKGSTKMVYCWTCGHNEAYDPQKHLNVVDAEGSNPDPHLSDILSGLDI